LHAVRVLRQRVLPALGRRRCDAHDRAYPHGDDHGLWIDPTDDNRMIESNDGGAAVSTDGAQTFTDENYSTAQICNVATTNDFPYLVCGEQQDPRHEPRVQHRRQRLDQHHRRQ
jgi:hypothetical protein